jgi:glycosyltransferase involved in cell wall biosynthesis
MSTEIPAPARRPNEPRIVVDRTHMGRRASGIERITEALFSPEALQPLHVTGTSSPGTRLGMMAAQMLANPTLALADRKTAWVFPGYPPSPAFLLMRERSVLYVHDLFLITRRRDLNRAARLYSAKTFQPAVRRLRYFLVNSLATGAQLAPFVQPDAEILPYRPPVANVFGLRPRRPDTPDAGVGPLRIGALGTIEPRKNFVAGARICAALAHILDRPVEYHVIGRQGWGDDFNTLSQMPDVRIHGFLNDESVRELVGTLDLLLCTSHDEGLGLPLLEIQHGGLPVAAPDGPVFHEVLERSGTFIDAGEPRVSAGRIAQLMAQPGWRSEQARLASDNLRRWNDVAEADRRDVVALLGRLAEAAAGAR